MSADGNSLAGPSVRLRELGIELPEAPAPLGSYVETAREGGLLFLSGILPLIHGKLPFAGRFGEELTIAEGREAARRAALNVLSAVDYHLPGVDRVKGLVRLGVFMVTTPDFIEHVPVADGASELFAEIFGKDPSHTRLVYGVQSLPLGAPLLLEAIFRIDEPAGDPAAIVGED